MRLDAEAATAAHDRRPGRPDGSIAVELAWEKLGGLRQRRLHLDWQLDPKRAALGPSAPVLRQRRQALLHAFGEHVVRLMAEVPAARGRMLSLSVVPPTVHPILLERWRVPEWLQSRKQQRQRPLPSTRPRGNARVPSSLGATKPLPSSI
jgi:hypothetical protein